MTTAVSETDAPYISSDGDVYTTHHILHRAASECSHEAHNFCAQCDSEGEMASQYGSLCPWVTDRQVEL